LSESELARELVETTGESTDRASRARIAKAIRRFGDYRWVGVYDVGGEEIALLGWDGPGAPRHIPASQAARAFAARRSPREARAWAATSLRTRAT
jgi:putative methionine-R-sulfoxide reductase with GAF domain